MREVEYQRWLPKGGAVTERTLLPEFLRREASIRMHLRRYKALPSMQDLNAKLLHGAGDDGFIMMSWEPFAVSVPEYEELAAALSDKG